MLITVSAFEWHTPKEEPVVTEPDRLWDDIDFIQPTVIEMEKPPKPKKVVFIPIETLDDDEPIDPEDVIGDWDDLQIDVDPNPLPPPVEDEPVEIPNYAEVMPTPVGGYDAFYQYVAKNVDYTRQARNLHVEGKVFVQFVVDKDGSITQVEIARGLGAGLDHEALEVMKNSPKWNPARQSGRFVKVRMIIPIHFKLN